MKCVFVLQHVHEHSNDYDDVKFIGVYSTRRSAEDAINRLSLQPGFKDTKDGFYIDEYEVDVDHWTEGYVTIQDDEEIAEDIIGAYPQTNL
ncbi:hypothetical protein H8E77_41900 [bacterium]|nr:hypothetical protein [bacterium]